MKGTRTEILPTDEAMPDDLPAPPDWLSEEGRAEWVRVLPVLLTERRTLSIADFGIFANYCEACGTVVKASRIVRDEGLTFTGPSGIKRHPAVGIRDAAMTQARQMAAELGLTPASRGRPAMKNGVVDDGLFGGLFGDLNLN